MAWMHCSWSSWCLYRIAADSMSASLSACTAKARWTYCIMCWVSLSTVPGILLFWLRHRTWLLIEVIGVGASDLFVFAAIFSCISWWWDTFLFYITITTLLQSINLVKKIDNLMVEFFIWHQSYKGMLVKSYTWFKIIYVLDNMNFKMCIKFISVFVLQLTMYRTNSFAGRTMLG